jgi:hypothetical protein
MATFCRFCGSRPIHAERRLNVHSSLNVLVGVHALSAFAMMMSIKPLHDKLDELISGLAQSKERKLHRQCPGSAVVPSGSTMLCSIHCDNLSRGRTVSAPRMALMLEKVACRPA